MEWSPYLAFLAFVGVLTVIPGPDTAVTVANSLRGGRGRGLWCVGGIGVASLIQSVAAAAGLSVLIVGVEPLFLAIKWVGAAYLLYLAVTAFRSARRGCYPATSTPSPERGGATAGLRQGFLCNICNPKIIAFYLAVLPQFLGTDPSAFAVAVYAVSMPLIGCAYLSAMVFGVDRARRIFSSTRVRRVMDGVTGTALVAFGVRLATE